MPVTSIRLEEDVIKNLDEMAQTHFMDRSSLIRKAINLGVKDLLLEEAIGRYQRGECSAWECAREAKISLWEFLDVLKRRGIFFKTDEVELENALREL